MLLAAMGLANSPRFCKTTMPHLKANIFVYCSSEAKVRDLMNMVRNGQRLDCKESYHRHAVQNLKALASVCNERFTPNSTQFRDPVRVKFR